MRLFRSFARLMPPVLIGLGAGLALPAPAGADVPAEMAAACQQAFGGPTTTEVRLVTDPPARSDAFPGQEVRLDASWTPGAWDSLSSVTACVRMDRVVDTALTSSEAPAADDGSYGHMFVVPQGLFNGTAICTRIRLAGDPVGDATEAVWVSRQSCLEVHPDGPVPPTTPAPTTPTTTVTPTTPTTTAVPAPPPAPTPAPAPSPVPQPVPAPPPADGLVSSPDETLLPRPAAPATDLGTPGQGSAGDGDRPSTRPPSAEGLGPLALPVLPETGAGAAGLAGTGLMVVATGVPILILGRALRRRHRPG